MTSKDIATMTEYSWRNQPIVAAPAMAPTTKAFEARTKCLQTTKVKKAAAAAAYVTPWTKGVTAINTTLNKKAAGVPSKSSNMPREAQVQSKSCPP